MIFNSLKINIKNIHKNLNYLNNKIKKRRKVKNHGDPVLNILLFSCVNFFSDRKPFTVRILGAVPYLQQTRRTSPCCSKIILGSSKNLVCGSCLSRKVYPSRSQHGRFLTF
jgi:hypothetical protein